ncbi:1-deoxy-D-xylulose-5-phosphate synthase [Companilactobacillus halodurans]|uniref:1-deoxy-D-xylulose-5-phosphate synthase n=1 Tax=Companilactobacillus halodurans TaxID=2584183 RepID=A0A5P0ZMC3_9LACO|nr:1-deoxy-D-xylulose-5-phosphate synthase [Companilactobacillus halodurans]MQS75410.1 1-deoxy-D-xylulose-5-phosphate synthase [Companilactobacillus halodurans]MQS97356.1 1-deoxy-D-xylulose-5-phosphate synthase [Companilactobacillus halodurans]
METPILNTINQPKDLKKLDVKQLTQLASEIRYLLLNKVSQTGGHVGPNLGVVELTIAFHTIFNSPIDKVVWDVSHQSYPHKILTGRKQAWLDPKHYDDVSGFTDPKESPHDYFNIGHTSTSIALATGMASARDLQNKSGNVMAVIGDGSLSGGLALEGLNIAATLKSNLIILVNDNEMAIAEDHGGIYAGLKELRESNGQSKNNLFKAMGLDYRYVENGNDIQTMLDAFKEVKDIDHPIVLHVHTQKGLGYQPAMDHKEAFHWHVPFDLETGKTLHPTTGETYNDVIHEQLEKEIKDYQTPITAITAAIPGSYDLKRFGKKHPDRYFDVGIAEQEAITFAAGQAQQGLRPIAFQSGTFLQRAYDQLSHDLGINKLPVTIMVQGGSITAGDPTHQGIFDIAMLSNIPGLTYLAPTTKEELSAMMHYALHQNDGPVAIRVPSNNVHSAELTDFDAHKMNILHRGKEVAILGVGSLLPLAETVQQKLALKNIDATVIDPRDISELDGKTLEALKNSHQLVVTLEEASLSGGFGEKVSHFFNNADMKVLNFGAAKRFNDRETTDELWHEFKLTPEQITAEITDNL